MRASLQWLNDLLDRPVSLAEAAERLTLAGFPVEVWGDTPDGDTWLEVELTSNRGDCLSHLGLAREIAAATGRQARDPSGSTGRVARTAGGLIPVTVQDTEACPFYSARVIRGVTAGPSPEWMQSRLRTIGQIPRNNLVDCTNYVLFELGQPTHVFDLQKLKGPSITVRHARAGETLLPIGDGAKPIALRAGDLVIADAASPVAIAGVKGGAASAITESTKDIVLEAATFAPRAVRSASRGLGITSDSSYRFERGVDPAQVAAASARLAELIVQTAGGTPEEGLSVGGKPVAPERTVTVRVNRCAALLGCDVSAKDMVDLLAPLGLRPTVDSGGANIETTIPPGRIDLEREVDLIEEVARLRGMDRIPMRDTIAVRAHPPSAQVQATRAAKDLLAGLGYLEAVTHTLISERAAASHSGGAGSVLRLDDERALAPVLRPSLVPSLLEVLATNTDRAGERPSIFEVARAFTVTGTDHREPTLIGAICPGDGTGESCYRTLRGAVERLVRMLTGSRPSFTSSSATGLAPSADVAVSGRRIGSIGLVTSGALKAAGVDGPVAAVELDLLESIRVFPPEVRVHALPSFPSTERDLSLVVDNAVSWKSLEGAVQSLGLPSLVDLRFVTTFRGKQVGANRKSVTMRLTFRADDRTLRREEADAATAEALKSLKSSFGAEVRS
ncbi:MAG: phenylalanine--tRNA ligase subunit beta [Planctomycetota bacterium]|nr:phenylalanine--tRNA ligase subunit beta [Planctomycetota bacterium]MDA1105787.1 phenylalanine--tRNA ligase subunit beta [Planctomycetota bacterium]